MSDARSAMIEAAERLIAERGLANVSLREVAAVAGQRSNNAVQYHFGDRNGLIEAIFEHRMGAANRRRLEMLAALEESDRADDVASLVEVFVVPFAELTSSSGSCYARFAGQILSDPTFAKEALFKRDAMAGVRIVLAKLHRALSDLPADVREARLRWLWLFTMEVLAEGESAAAANANRGRARGSAASPILVSSLVGMLTAPASPDS